MKMNPIGGQTVTTPKQEPIHYDNTRGRQNQQYNQNNQRGRGSFRGRPYPRRSQNARGQQHQQQRNTNYKQCFKCGNQYGPNHLQSCPAKDKICSKCAKRGHFAKVCCCSTNVNYLGNTNEEQQEETENESTRTDTDPLAYAEFITNNDWENYQIDGFSVMAISESFEIEDTKTRSEDNLNRHIVKLRTNTTELFAIADSGSPMSFLNEKTAQRLRQNKISAKLKDIPPEDTTRNLACYNGEYIQPKGRLIVTIESGGWKVQTVPFIIVDNQKANILGRNLLPRIGIRLIQDKPTQKVLTVQRSDESNHQYKQWVKDNFQQLCVRIGKSKQCVTKKQFDKDFEPLQKKGIRITIHLEERTEAELNKLIDQKHIIKLDKSSDKKLSVQ